MLKFIAAIALLFLPDALFAGQSNLHLFFLNLSKLEFDSARQMADQEPDRLLRTEMRQLTDILYYEGQTDKAKFELGEPTGTNDKSKITLSIVSELKAGYLSLFYDQLKGDAFRHFYKAYQLAERNADPVLLKPCLLAILKYYDKEIAQNTDAYMPYLNRLESLQSDIIDRIWITVYRIAFYSEPSEPTDDYYKLFETLNWLEKKIKPNSPVQAYMQFERSLKLDIQKKFLEAKENYIKTVSLSKDYPFLRNLRFFSFIKLMMIECRSSRFKEAHQYLAKVKQEIDLADTLRSSYHLNLHHSFLLNAEHKNDSAFMMLKKAYAQDFHLDFRRNTIEITKLNVELETQEKENANLQLKQNRNWLISALVASGLLIVIGYFVYANQRSKNKIQAKEKEVQAMKLEKVLKDQEIFGIDAMLEGQEKERQRIAGDLHDNLGSLLAAVKLHFHGIKSSKDFNESEQSELQTTDELLDEAYRKVRSMAHAGNVGVNAQEGLVPAVRNFASKVSVHNKLTIEVEENGMDRRLENSLEITIFRIIQELITNIIKHAHAQLVEIHLTQHEDAINLMVEDNGIGFDISKIKPSGGMGLHSIQKKIENLGGRVTIDSIVQKGTTVIIDIPLA